MIRKLFNPHWWSVTRPVTRRDFAVMLALPAVVVVLAYGPWIDFMKWLSSL
jgi:hypothetical protein